MTKIFIEGKDILHTGKNILESLENAGLTPHFHCRDGFCGVCRCKLVSGDVKYNNEPLAFIRQGEILTCASQPITDVELEF